MDRFLGSLFGFVRGILLVALAIIIGQFADLDEAGWWKSSFLIPHLETVADWDQGNGATRVRFDNAGQGGGLAAFPGRNIHGVIHVRRHRNR